MWKVVNHYDSTNAKLQWRDGLFVSRDTNSKFLVMVGYCLTQDRVLGCFGNEGEKCKVFGPLVYCEIHVFNIRKIDLCRLNVS